jgi:hypothetical protein
VLDAPVKLGRMGMNEEEIVKILMSSPEALEAFKIWMKLKWGELIIVGIFIASVSTGIATAVGYALWSAIRDRRHR